MKYLPIHIINFSTQYRMGCISAPIQFVMNELNAAACPTESIPYLSGLFKEESDMIFIGFTRLQKDKKTGHILICSEDIETIHPLSYQASQMMPQLIEKELISEPVENELREKMLSFRNKELARRGSSFLMRLFGIEDTTFLDGLGKTWFNTLEKYIYDQNFNPKTLPEFLMTYERTKNFNKNAIGILEDAASLVKQFYGLPDGYHPAPVKENETLFPADAGCLSDEQSGLKDGESQHDWVYLRLKKVAQVRKELLDSNETSFTSLLEKVNSNTVFSEFNIDLRATESEPERWFQLIMIYLQFRLKIREGIQGENAAKFWYFVKDILMIMPKETITALYLAGERFGINEFVSLFVFMNHPPKVRPAEIIPEEPVFKESMYKYERKAWNAPQKTFKLHGEGTNEQFKQKKQSTPRRKGK